MFMTGLLLMLTGMVMAIKPDWFWQITEAWKSNDATEPSSFYMWSTRMGGVIFFMVGVSAFIVTLIE